MIWKDPGSNPGGLTKKIKKISLHFIKWKVFRYIYVNNEIKTFLTWVRIPYDRI
jgi:hypothetical protein